MQRAIRGPILLPRADRTIDYIADGLLVGDSHGRLSFAGPWADFVAAHGAIEHERASGLILPPLLDLHTHVPQYPIRGHFTDGVADDAPEGRLLAGLNRNVFPAEERFGDLGYARRIVDQFTADTLRNGVVGGCAFLTVHAEAAFDSLHRLSPLWHGGLVLMDQNCPPRLRNNSYVQPDLRNLAESLGRRLVVTDRFAVATSAPLRQYGAAIAREFGLMTQTHLNEQREEKKFVEQTLYPDADSYTQVYLRDGLLDTKAILAHCIHMTDAEWAILQSRKAVVAHCPTSNALLGSGILSLDEVIDRGIDYAICTDVGASPSVSLLAEMAMFLLVHRGRSRHATACEALWRTTRGAAEILGIDDRTGTFEVGRELSYVVLQCPSLPGTASAEDVIRRCVLRIEDWVPNATLPHAEDLATGAPSHETLAAF
ncbi:MAG: amidohydrolase family protein, partial [Tepidisphaeraceae bacterium]